MKRSAIWSFWRSRFSCSASNFSFSLAQASCAKWIKKSKLRLTLGNNRQLNLEIIIS